MLRRRPRFSTFACLAAVAAGLGALVACSSVPELTFVEDDGGMLLPDGAVVPKDSGFDVDPNCKKSGPEICDDGIDNDCNGATDCQDTACGAFSCQDAPPDWTAVEFAAAARPACSSNTAMIDLRVSAGDGSATCNCSCGAVGGSCTAGTWTLTTGTDAACAVGVATKTVPLNTGLGNCTAIGSSFGVGASIMKTAPTGPTSCNATAAVNGPISNGRLCQPSKYGKGCGTNQVCAPKPPGGATSCVTKLGASACPGGFTKRNTAGTTENDQRTCTGCACAAPASCTGGSVSVYEGSMCKTNGANADRAENIGTACGAAQPTASFTAMYVKSTAPTGGGCGAPTTPATPGGALTFTDQRTVCCK